MALGQGQRAGNDIVKNGKDSVSLPDSYHDSKRAKSSFVLVTVYFFTGIVSWRLGTFQIGGRHWSFLTMKLTAEKTIPLKPVSVIADWKRASCFYKQGEGEGLGWTFNWGKMLAFKFTSSNTS